MIIEIGPELARILGWFGWAIIIYGFVRSGSKIVIKD